MANKLELTWVGKEDKIEIEPRILIEKPELGYSYSQAKKDGKISIDKVSNADGINDNMLIHGDNLLALKALEQEYAGKVKCIYIDPPYNTGSAFEHYDDNIEHSTWLSLIKPRLEILEKLLSEDGCIFCQIDYNEQAYLKLIMDEIFTRKNFLTMITCKVKAPSGVASGAAAFFDCSEYILCYAKNKNSFNFNSIKYDSIRIDEKAQNVTNVYNQVFTSFDEDTFEAYQQYEDINIKILSKFQVETIKKSERSQKKYFLNYKDIFRLAAISGGRDKKVLSYLQSLKDYDPYKVYSYSYIASQGKNKGKQITNYIYKNGNILFLKDFIRVDDDEKAVYKQDITTNIFYNDWWQGLTSEGANDFKNGKKPEKLLELLLNIVSNPGDLVLDSFLGSGTTAAVAHKMGRRWIGIEMGEHAYTHCKVRLDKVVSGEDQGGISKAQNWKGGGGYKFYELAPSLILRDKFNRDIINPFYNADMLASAMAKQEGCVYCPSAECYWKQAKSTENAYLYTTTQHLTREYLDEIAGDLKENEHLIIACKSFESSLEHAYKNITIKKIPNILLDRCEFGKSDYKLNVVDMPVLDVEEDDE